MDEKKTILIVDDHPLFREGLVSLLSKHPGFKIIGEVAEGEKGVMMAKKLHPDVVIMDISLPDITGIDATRDIRESLPGTKVIILSIHSKIDYITDAFKAGAFAYLTKEATGEKLVECLETVNRGEYYMDSVVSQRVVKSLLMTEEEKGRYQDPSYRTLTSREQEIMRLLAEGLSSKQIGEKLFISQKTVENHRTSIFNKLNIHSTMELVRYAAKYGLIDVDLWKT